LKTLELKHRPKIFKRHNNLPLWGNSLSINEECKTKNEV
jgi:hypothetical protein